MRRLLSCNYRKRRFEYSGIIMAPNTYKQNVTASCYRDRAEGGARGALAPHFCAKKKKKKKHEIKKIKKQKMPPKNSLVRKGQNLLAK